MWIFFRSIRRRALFNLLKRSLHVASREQCLSTLAHELSRVVPDLTDQYSTFRVNSLFAETKVRFQHAFQISLVRRVLSEFTSPIIVDIGDSSGTHIQYLKALEGSARPMRCVSVNLDPEAVKKIKTKGLEAVHARAEELDRVHMNADIFLCFETLEHLSSPVQFLHDLSSKTAARYLILTVPYVARTRVGLHHIRNDRRDGVNAERTHLMECAPEDLRLLVQHCGWAVAYEQRYLQYPRFHPYRLTRSLWRRYDFEGFYGMILTRDDTWSRLYTDW